MQDDNMNQQGGMPNNSSDDNMEHKDDQNMPMGDDQSKMPAGEGHEEGGKMPEGGEEDKGGGDSGNMGGNA